MLETISVTIGTLEPWLGTWAETRTETADRNLRDTVDWWLIEGGIADLHFGCEDPQTAGASSAATTPQVTASFHDFAVSLHSPGLG